MTNLSTLRNAIQQFDTNLFTPYAVGFDRTFDRLFDYATHQATSTGFPPYNIAKDGDYTYTIEMALAGFSKKDIEVKVEESLLTVSSVSETTTKSESGENINENYVHRGIAKRSFSKQFNLSDDIIVKSADLKDGMLIVNLEREIPEEKKPRVIPIS